MRRFRTLLAAVILALSLAAAVTHVHQPMPQFVDIPDQCKTLTPDDWFWWWWYGCGKDTAGGGGGGAG